MSTPSSVPRAWDQVSGLASDEPVRRLEAAWKSSRPGHRPDPADFVGNASAGVRLAVYRADLGLRWDSGDRVGVEVYRGCSLTDDTLIALAYEEFCLREDCGETPCAASFYRRFPEIASGLKRVLEIHDLVGSGRGNTTASLGLRDRSSNAIPFPDAGQTIAGFHLVEELGRGGFARVFLAKERQLADRFVALKVATAGSREPQTLARLQHTHIVPVHSYRTDPATGLHLLCMPFFGRVTLAHLLSDDELKEARSGSQIVQALDRLDPGGMATASTRPVGREALEGRPFARAIAWWGARLAEALQHAHDRGVLHRDVKPSNVLVTADGMPMLLDFNLAHEPFEPDDVHEIPAALGGTVAYMSPEHLEALADGRSDGVDARSDIYALGIVLFEAMGARPFGSPPQSRSVREALLRAAEERRREPPRLRDTFPEVPAAYATVVERCLSPDPRDRYATAAELATDLQDVADDLPLHHAREPIGVRLLGKVRRHRRAMAATTVVLLAVGVAVFGTMGARMATEKVLDQAAHLFDKAVLAEQNGLYAVAADGFETTARLCLASDSPPVVEMGNRARVLARINRGAANTLQAVDTFFEDAEKLRWTLLGFDEDRKDPGPTIDDVLKPFYVYASPNWTAGVELDVLGEERRARLVSEVHELLFLGALATAGTDLPKDWRTSRAICEKARQIQKAQVEAGDQTGAATLPSGPWKALERYVTARIEGRATPRCSPPLPATIASAWECYQWGRLLLLEDRPDPRRAADWLVRAAQRDHGRFWLEFDAGYQADRAGRSETALEHYNAAVELNPKSARALSNRARLERAKGAWERAREDLERALVESEDLVEARLELGLVQQSLGDKQAAIVSYNAVINAPNAGPLRRAALFNRAMIDFEMGRSIEARSQLDRMIELNPDDESARLGRAQISLREGDLASAERDLDAARRSRPEDSGVLALRAMVYLKEGRAQEALADARKASRLEPSLSHDRLVVRARLATRTGAVPILDDPGEVRMLPGGGRSLADDMLAASDRLARGDTSPASLTTRAVILAALGQRLDAEREASRAVEDAPFSPRAWLVRARVRADRGALQMALDDVGRGLEIEPEDPRLLQLRGELSLKLGDPIEAITDLDLALRLGAGPSASRARAQALSLLGRPREALECWNRVIASDPNDAAAFLGRARVFLAIPRWDQALADLEHACGLAGERRDLLAGIAWSYLHYLRPEPGRWPRVLALVRRAIAPRPVDGFKPVSFVGRTVEVAAV